MSAILASMSASENAPDRTDSWSSVLMSFSRPSVFAHSMTRCHFGDVVVVEHSENFVEFRQRREQRRNIILFDSAGIEGGVGLAHHLEDCGLRLRRIEIIVQRGSHRRQPVASDSIAVSPPRENDQFSGVAEIP